VVHARPAGLQGSREPLQFGAELYGHSGLEADLEIQDLALDCLNAAGVGGLLLDLADARIVRSLLSGVAADSNELMAVYDALAAKDAEAISRRTQGFPDEARRGLLALTTLYGDVDVLAAAQEVLPSRPPIRAALADLRRLAEHAAAAHPTVQVGFDLADLAGYAYYSGARFAVYATGCSDSLVRGGRYDEVGAVFGRNRPAVGFSTDLKQLPVPAAPRRHAAVLAPWSEEADLRAAVRKLRAAGDTVVCVLPGRENEVQEFDCDREIVAVDGRWVVRAR
jgi:ATP phosphoribosyltransferase regulatory subunit